LIDKVYSPRNLLAASASVIGNEGGRGVDHQTVEDFLAHRQEELDRLHEALADVRTDRKRCGGSGSPNQEARSNDHWACQPFATAWYKPRCCTCWNRFFDATFSEHSYGFRHGRGCHHALERVEQLLAPTTCTSSMRTSRATSTRSRNLRLNVADWRKGVGQPGCCGWWRCFWSKA